MINKTCDLADELYKDLMVLKLALRKCKLAGLAGGQREVDIAEDFKKDAQQRFLKTSEKIKEVLLK